MAIKIDTASARKRLKARPAPYWQKLGPKRAIGIKKTTVEEIWKAKINIPPKRHQITLGSDLEFEEALQLAHQWFETFTGPTPSALKVKHAVSDYLDYLHRERSQSTYKAEQSRAMIHVLPQLGEQNVSSLTTADYERWRDARLAHFLKKATPDDEGRRKAKYNTNCLTKLLKASLNRAHRKNRSLPKQEWDALKPLEGGTTVGRKVFLTNGEPQRLISALDGGARDIVLAGLLTGARFGELAAAKVRDIDFDLGQWDVASGKTGPRCQILTSDAIDLFRRLCAGKEKHELVFLRDDGKPWNKDNIQPPFRQAVAQAKLDKATSFYSLRHSYISQHLKSGIPPQALAENVGTSVRMIEKHYGKFLASDKRRMLEAGRIAVDVPKTNVVAL